MRLSKRRKWLQGSFRNLSSSEDQSVLFLSAQIRVVLCLVFSLFSKLALLLRQRITAFGHDVQISVRCLQTLVQGIDARWGILSDFCKLWYAVCNTLNQVKSANWSHFLFVGLWCETVRRSWGPLCCLSSRTRRTTWTKLLPTWRSVASATWRGRSPAARPASTTCTWCCCPSSPPCSIISAEMASAKISWVSYSNWKMKNTGAPMQFFWAFAIWSQRNTHRVCFWMVLWDSLLEVKCSHVFDASSVLLPVGEQQLCCYRILNALYALGTSSSSFVQRCVQPRASKMNTCIGCKKATPYATSSWSCNHTTHGDTFFFFFQDLS